MPNTFTRLAVTLAAGAALSGGMGCASHQAPPPTPRVAVKPVRVPPYERDEVKPLPQRRPESPIQPPPFEDPPLVSQRPPEQRAFVDAYNAVGRPRILVFVNRKFDSAAAPAGAPDTRAPDDRSRTGRRDVFLRQGDYDAATGRNVDYEAIENQLTDWLASEGSVEVISPTMARQRLTAEQIKNLQEGQARASGEIAKQLDADVLVQVQAQPVRQTADGLDLRMTAEAVNVGHGGQSLARAAEELHIPHGPLDPGLLANYTRMLARRLMDGMTGSWRAMADADRAAPGPRDGAAPREPAPREPAPREPASRDLIDRRDGGPVPTQPASDAPSAAPSSAPSSAPSGGPPGVPPAGNR